MREMWTIVTDVRGVCLSVCLSRMHRMTPHSEADLRASLGGVLGCSLWHVEMRTIVVADHGVCPTIRLLVYHAGSMCKND